MNDCTRINSKLFFLCRRNRVVHVPRPVSDVGTVEEYTAAHSNDHVESGTAQEREDEV